jgi:serine/threonine protein kinase
MGCSKSLQIAIADENAPLASNRWRVKMSAAESKSAFEADGTLPPNASDDMVALRVYLEDPNSLGELAKYAKECNKLDLLLCWFEVLRYKFIDVEGNGLKLSVANGIYHKYYKGDAIVCILKMQALIDGDCRQTVTNLLQLAASTPDFFLPDSLFDHFGHICLSLILTELFQSFRKTPAYSAALVSRRNQFNKMELKNFEYMEALGEGSFGMVVHCKKKTTGRHYAMKIQCKRRLLEQYPDHPERVVYEKEAVSKCHHPFIISMDYAFQTKRLAIMVTALGSGESLDSLSRISEERALFYCAEIVLALDHIHKMGMIYRDLKPANVLLNADGHIQLVDLGCVVDVSGKTLGTHGYYEDPNDEHAVLFGVGRATERHAAVESESTHSNGNSLVKGISRILAYASNRSSGSNSSRNETDEVDFLPTVGRGVKRGDSSISSGRSVSMQNRKSVGLIVKQSESSTTAKKRTGHYNFSMAERPSIGTLKRANSIKGTGGFMAPEMVALLMCGEDGRHGYTKAVDYWSLGVTLFILLLNSLPFRQSQVAGFSGYVGKTDSDGNALVPPDFKKPTQQLAGLVEQHTLTSESMQLILSFLEIDDKKRLGRSGVADVMTHPAFSNIPWSLLEEKLVTPPSTGNTHTFGSEKGGDAGSENSQGETAPYPSFNEMMKAEGYEFMAAVYQCEELLPSEQKYYSTW